MNYPIKSSELPQGMADNDEQATLIVVESILSNTFDDLEIVDPSVKEDLKIRTKSSEKFDEFSKLISTQKALLNRTIVNNSSVNQELNSDEITLSNQLANKAFLKTESDLHAKKRNKIYATFSMAACALLLFFGLSVFLDPGSTGRKSSVDKMATSQSKSLQDESLENGDKNPSSGAASSPTNEKLGLDKQNSEQSTDQSPDEFKENDSSADTNSTTNAPRDSSRTEVQNSSSEAKSDSKIAKTLYLVGIVLVGIALLVLTVLIAKKKSRSE